MNNDLYRVGKIAISQKLPDRFLMIKSYQPKGDGKEYGALYFLIEITTPWFPATEIGKTIEKSIISNYYGVQKYKSIEERFEESLKKTNLVLADLAQKGDTNWVGNLNVTIIAVCDDKIHITNTGINQSLLFRNNSLKNIYEIEKTTRSPIQTFSNVISGNLDAEDKILITNSELFNQIHNEQIKAILQSFDPITGIHEIAKILRKKKIQNVNCFILEFIAKDKIAFQPPPELTDTIYLDQREDVWFEKAIKKTKPTLSRTKEKIKNNYQATKEKTTPALKRFTIAIGKGVISMGSFLKSLSSNLNKSRREKARDRIRSGNIKEWEDFIDKPKTPSRSNNIIGTISSIFSFLSEQLILLFTKRKKILIIIILAILLFIGINTIRKNLSGPKIDAVKIIQEAQAKEDQAKSELTLNNKERARNLFFEALDILKPAKENLKQDEKVKEIYSRIQGEIDEMDNIKKLNQTEPVFNFAGQDSNPQINEIILFNKYIFAANKNNNKILKILESDFSVRETAQISTQDGQIQSVTPYSNLILWKTNSKIIYSLNINSNSLQKQKTNDNEWKNGIGISGYSRNIYFLVPLENQIYKYTSGTSGWTGPTNTLDNSNVDISKAVSFDIDGYIYVLNQDGNCLKFSRGNLISDFSLVNIPPPVEKIEDPISIKTSTETNSLYILDGKHNRILDFSKDGNYLQQYVLPDIGQVKSFTINYKTNKIYVLADTYIYQFNL